MNALVPEVMYIILQGILSMFFFHLFFERNKLGYRFVAGWILYFVFQIVLTLNMESCFNIVGIFIMYLMWSSLIYKGKILKKAIFSLVFISFGIVSEVLYICVLLITQYHVNTVVHFGRFCSSSILLAFIILSKVLINQDNSKEDYIGGYIGGLFFLITLGSIGVVFTIDYLVGFDKQHDHIILVFFNILVVLLINIFVFLLYSRQAKHLELVRYNTVYEQQIMIHENYMKEREMLWNMAREQRHNFNQKIIIMEQLIRKEEYLPLLEFVEDLRDAPQDKMKISHTENMVVDSLINYKYSLFLKQKIKFDIDLSIPTDVPIKATDLCIVLGNLLDNAIEAVNNIEADNRIIKIRMRYDCNALYIIIENHFSGERKKGRDGHYRSTKSDSTCHGIGIQSVKRIVESYDGVMEIEERDDLFCVNLAMYF